MMLDTEINNILTILRRSRAQFKGVLRLINVT